MHKENAVDIINIKIRSQFFINIMAICLVSILFIPSSLAWTGLENGTGEGITGLGGGGIQQKIVQDAAGNAMAIGGLDFNSLRVANYSLGGGWTSGALYSGQYNSDTFDIDMNAAGDWIAALVQLDLVAGGTFTPRIRVWGSGVTDLSSFSTNLLGFTADDVQLNVAMGENGDAIVVWQNGTELRYRLFTSGSWGAEAVLDTFTPPAGNFYGVDTMDVAADANGNFIVVWNANDSQDIGGRRITGGIVSARETIGSATGIAASEGHPQVEMYGNGQAIVVWEHHSGTHTGIAANRFNGSSWSGQQSIDAGAGAGSLSRFPHIAVQEDGKAFVSFGQGEPAQLHMYANRLYGGTWEGAVEIGCGLNVLPYNIDMDGYGNAAAGFSSSGNVITRMYAEGVGWLDTFPTDGTAGCSFQGTKIVSASTTSLPDGLEKRVIITPHEAHTVFQTNPSGSTPVFIQKNKKDVRINSVAVSSASAIVNLDLTLPYNDICGVTPPYFYQEMRFSNDGVSWSSWEAAPTTTPYTTTKNGWDLTSNTYGGNPSGGVKRVFIQFRNANCESLVTTDEINYTGSAAVDTDGDGVTDDYDQCPGTPAGEAVDINGCGASQLDSDGDGVVDSADTCPFDAQNDIDSDGVCGDVDNCPFIANPAQTDANNNGVGDDCERSPVDIVLVLDLSGSMASTVPGGGMSKIGLLQRAVELFVQEWNEYDVPGDQVGVVYFESTLSQQNTPLLVAFDGNQANIISSVNNQSTGNYTAMGGGLQRALNTLVSSANSKRHIILFTDGMQNCSPMVRELSPDGGVEPNHEIRSEPVNPAVQVYCDSTEPGVTGKKLEDYATQNQIKIHTIGTGVSTDLWRNLLSNIANELGGEQHFTSDPDAALTRTFIEHLVTVLSENTLEIVGYRSGSMPRDSNEKQEAFTINRFAKKATFVLSWQNTDGQTELGMRILGPNNIELKPSYVKKAGYYQLASFVLPLAPQRVDNKVIRPEHKGTWNMLIDGKKINLESVAYDAVLLVDEPRLKYDFRVDKSDYGTGDSILLTARVNEENVAIRPLQKVSVKVEKPRVGFGTFLSINDVSQPDMHKDLKVHADRYPSLADKKGYLLIQDESLRSDILPKHESIVLYDDGNVNHGDETANDGIYSMLYTDTQYPGTYTFTFLIDGNSSLNGDFSRTRRVTTEVRIKTADQGNTRLGAHVLEKGDDGRLVDIRVTPRDAHKNYLGPGYTNQISITSKNAQFTGSVVDKLDGSYSRSLRYSGLGVDPNVIVDVQGNNIFDGSVSELIPRYSISAHLGSAIPMSTFNNMYDPGYSIILDFEYAYTQQLSALGLLGYNQFKGTGVVNDTHWWNVSGNVKYKFTQDPTSLYINGGVGVYIPKSGSTKPGYNIGIGFDYSLSRDWTFEVGADYHNIFTAGDDTKYVVPHLGVIYHF